MKVVIAPDSFKGTMSATEICEIIKKELCLLYKDISCECIPIADGGEGSLDAFMGFSSGERVFVKASDLYFSPLKVPYGIINGDCAIIELATVAGLPQRKPLVGIKETTTYGVGELISEALNKGLRRIILAVGGSATNDAGCGMLAALGVKFYRGNEEFIPRSGDLSSITSIDPSQMDRRIKDCEITVMCDINNPLYGENGAAYIFSPQKGATPDEVRELDDGLRNFAKITEKLLRCPPTKEGDGAAGGIAYGIRCYLGGELKSGIDVVLSAAGFERKLSGAALVITGEGRLDAQSLQGKVISGVARRATLLGIPVVAVVGCVKGDVEELRQKLGLRKIVITNAENLPFSEVKKRCFEQLAVAVRKIF